MRKEGRGKEHDTTMHLIKIQIFTHASRVTKFSQYELCTYRQLFEIPEPLGLVQSFCWQQSSKATSITKRLTMFKCSNTQLQNGTGDAWPS